MATKNRRKRRGRRSGGKPEDTQFKEGHKGGRPVGSPNKHTRIIKEAIVRAAEAVGTPQVIKNKRGQVVAIRKTGKDGLIGYLIHVALYEPKAFCMLLGRTLPTQIIGEMAVKEAVPVEQLEQTLAERGVPVQLFDFAKLMIDYQASKRNEEDKTIDAEILDDKAA